MNTKKRQLVYILLTIGLLSHLAVSNARTMRDQRAAAETARKDYLRCRDMADDLKALGPSRDRPADRTKAAGEIQGAVERQAKAAGITLDAVIDVSPLPPQRLGDTLYKEQPTTVRLENVSLKNLVTLVHRLADRDNSLYPKSIQIRAPQQQGAEERWTTEIILTYLIYDPPQKTR
jgi:hypothetical protein